MTTVVVLSQQATELELRWHEGDPLAPLSWLVANAPNLATFTYECDVRYRRTADSPVLGSITVLAQRVTVDDLNAVEPVATVDANGPHTMFTASMTSVVSKAIGPGVNQFDIQQVGGITVFTGTVVASPEVTVL